MSDKKKHIDDFIRDNFDQEAHDFDFGSWNDLEKKLDRDNEVDNVVISAYDFAEEDVPSSVWNNVNDELDIDTVWQRINSSLNDRKRRLIWWWNVASVAMGIVFLFLLINGLIHPKDIQQQYVYENSELSIDSIEQVQDKSAKVQSNLTSHSIDGTDNVDESITIAKKEKTPLKTSANFEDQPKKEQWNTEQIEVRQKVSDDIETSNQSIKSTVNVSDFSLPLINLLKPRINRRLAMDKSHLVDSLSFSQLDSELNEDIKHWTAGITSGILSTNLMDALFRESISENSLVTPEFSLAINPGVFAQYRTSTNWFLQADLYLNYRISRRVSLYEDLSYVSRKTELSYQRLHFYGGKQFMISNSLRSSTYFETAIGGFVSYLSDQREFRGRTLISEEKTLSDWNIGLDADVGIVHRFDRLSIAYGAQVNKGLLNVMKEVSNKSWNRASTLSTGVYLRLGYQF